MKIIEAEFFTREDTLWLAAHLLGKLLVTRLNGAETIGRIVETEAYLGETDRASHAWAGRRTTRTETMYLPGGHAYVYLCYGIHHLFNIVTHRQHIPHAILVRALQPVQGVDTMLLRRGKLQHDFSLTRGPGSLAKAMGIRTTHSGLALTPEKGIFLADDGFEVMPDEICASPRIGVDYAGQDAALPYRYYIAGNKNVSRPNR